jgi:DNA polymerase kappa
MNHLADYDGGEEADSMPGFHELDENDVELSQDSPEDVELVNDEFTLEMESKDDQVASSSKLPPPAHTLAGGTVVSEADDTYMDAPPFTYTLVPSRQSTKPHSAGPIKQRKGEGKRRHSGNAEASAGMGASHGSDPDLRVHTCPVCGKTLEADNQGLNAHVDFCLSRGAIRDAQANAGNPVKPVSGGGIQWAKSDPSKGKRRRG